MAPQASAAVRDYGTAIKELASVNIFPGDMLFKNFGVTRGGRVVFYDYDEITYMTETNFRRIPAAAHSGGRDGGGTLVSCGGQRRVPRGVRAVPADRASKVRDAFLALHGDLLAPEYWNEVKERVAAGQIADVFPYPESARFARRFASRGDEEGYADAKDAKESQGRWRGAPLGLPA